jgi:2-dehydropantoate 2-reductase
VRIAIFGAGATGGHLAVRLAAAGHAVSAVARGAHLQAIRDGGLTLESGAERLTMRIAASDRPAELGVQDAVLVMVKATGLAAVAPALAPLVGPETLVVFPQNGIPWWYPLGLEADRPRPPDLPVFKLGAAFQAVVPMERIAGGVIHSANEVTDPGVVRNGSPGRNRLTIGALAPAGEVAVAALRAALEGAGIAAPAPDDLRAAVWRKLLANMGASTLGLVTGQPSAVVRDDPAVGEVFLRILREGLAIAKAHGIDLTGEISPEAIRDGIAPHHRASILQDYEAGRPMEVAEIILAPQAFARASGIATPTLDAVAAIAASLARTRGLFFG